MTRILNTLILLAAIFYLCKDVQSAEKLSDYEKDLVISRKEKLVLNKFKKRVEGRLNHAYMKTDLYLIRWLRAKSFNIGEAEEMLITNLNWRKANNMDKIHQEDWSEFMSKYPYHLDTVDKEGKPILYFNPGEWDIRQLVITGGDAKFSRYIDSALDRANNLVRDLYEKHQNASQGMLIVNLEGYNVVQHGCLQCIPVILRGILTYEKYYPGLAYRIYLVNSPAIFEPLLQTIRAALSPASNKALKIFGMNKNEWKNELFNKISKDQLYEELGGTKHVEEDDSI